MAESDFDDDNTFDIKFKMPAILYNKFQETLANVQHLDGNVAQAFLESLELWIKVHERISSGDTLVFISPDLIFSFVNLNPLISEEEFTKHIEKLQNKEHTDFELDKPTLH